MAVAGRGNYISGNLSLRVSLALERIVGLYCPKNYYSNAILDFCTVDHGTSEQNNPVRDEVIGLFLREIGFSSDIAMNSFSYHYVNKAAGALPSMYYVRDEVIGFFLREIGFSLDIAMNYFSSHYVNKAAGAHYGSSLIMALQLIHS